MTQAVNTYILLGQTRVDTDFTYLEEALIHSIISLSKRYKQSGEMMTWANLLPQQIKPCDEEGCQGDPRARRRAGQNRGQFASPSSFQQVKPWLRCLWYKLLFYETSGMTAIYYSEYWQFVFVKIVSKPKITLGRIHISAVAF